MALSDFPQEIVDRIANYLYLEDKDSCTLVCKKWNTIFANSMHSDVFVSKPFLSYLVNPPQDYQQPYQETRHLVRYLYIDYNAQATDEELYALQKTFPNIRYIYFESDSITDISFGVSADWNIWRLLREVTFSFEFSNIPEIENKIVETIICLPLLKRFEIINIDTEPKQISFSLNHFETIHSHLKQLGYLKLNTDLMALSNTDLERISQVLPATTMGSLNIISKKADHRWLCYFSHKYPNLHTLKTWAKDILPDSKNQRNNTIALFRKTPMPFQRLKSLNLDYFKCVGEEHLLFWNIINIHDIPLKHISIYNVSYGTPSSSGNLYDSPKRIAIICLTKFSKTIETFRLESPNTYGTSINLAEIKDSLCNLVELSIDTSTSGEIDTLLCAAPSLKLLSFQHADIKVKDELYSSKRFSLQSFKVTLSNITSDVLRFLSFHCRSLYELNLIRTSVSGDFTTPGCQFIDMTYTRLQSLLIADTDFTIKGTTSCSDNLNITLITRPLDEIPPKSDYNPKVLPVVIGGPDIKAHYDWFCKYNGKTSHSISKSRGSRVEKFVSNYEENKRITLARALYTKRGKPYVSWRNNCIFGYTKIKLGYVTDCKI